MNVAADREKAAGKVRSVLIRHTCNRLRLAETDKDRYIGPDSGCRGTLSNYSLLFPREKGLCALHGNKQSIIPKPTYIPGNLVY